MRGTWTKFSLPIRLLIGLFCFLCLFYPVLRFYHYQRNKQLWAAAEDGRTAEVQKRLSQGADPNYAVDGLTVLDASLISDNNLQTATLLWQHGARLGNLPDFQELALYHAQERKDTAMVRFLQRAGAKENLRWSAKPLAHQPQKRR